MVKLLTLCLLIISIVSFVIAQYPIAQINCGVETHSQTTYNYFTPAPFWYHTFNSGGWHVKEASQKKNPDPLNEVFYLMFI
jgi:hypothetical protein